MGSGDYTRELGVIEAMTLVTRQCPNFSVRSCAERALEAAKGGDATTLRQQVFLVVASMKGWRGERAEQIHRSLRAFLASGEHATPQEAATADSPPERAS